MPTHYVDLRRLAETSEETLRASRERALAFQDVTAYAVLSPTNWRVEGRASLTFSGQISHIEIDGDHDSMRVMVLDEIEHCSFSVRFADSGVFVLEIQLDFWDGGDTSRIFVDLPRLGLQSLPQPPRGQPYSCAHAAVIKSGDALRINFEGGFHNFRLRRIRIEKTT